MINVHATNLRAKLHLVFGVLIAATRRGWTAVPHGKCILYSASDGNRGQRGVDGFFSPILNPIQSYYHGKSFQIVNLSYPLSYYHSREISGGAILLNRQAIWILMVSVVEQLMLGKNAASIRKSFRRTRLLKKLLGALKPKLIFAFQATPELCRAAHELNVSVIEPMHGMNLSPNDQIFRSTIVGIDTNLLPDAYLAYDDRTAETLRGLLGARGIGVVRMPHPAHIAAHGIEPKLPSEESSSPVLSKAGLVKILVTLQWGYDGERASLSNIIPNGVLHPAIEQTIVENQDVMWLLRLHPVQVRTRSYKKHRNYVKALSERCPNVEWQDATALPLASILANVQGHITMTSGSVGEAAIFGVPSLLLCPTLKPNGVHSGWFTELADGALIEFGELDSGYINNWIRRVINHDFQAEQKDWKLEKEKFSLAMGKVLETYGSNREPVSVSKKSIGIRELD